LAFLAFAVPYSTLAAPLTAFAAPSDGDVIAGKMHGAAGGGCRFVEGESTAAVQSG
jgi:hypothetical protein